MGVRATHRDPAPPPIDRVFRALSDPTRRRVLERLSSRPASVSELAEPFDMALPSFLQHLRVLEQCGLVRSRKKGRVRTYHLAPARMRLAEGWLARQRVHWQRRLDQLDQHLQTMKEQTVMTRSRRFQPNPRLDLVLERTVDVPRELVWKAWTDPEQLKKWFTPAPWTTPDCEIDLRPGGIFRTVMRSPEGEEYDNAGCYLEIVENEKLVWTNALEPGYRPARESEEAAGDDLVFTGVVMLEPHGTGTKYTAIAIHRDEADRARHEEMGFHAGWAKALEQLVAVVRKA